ncbi:MAG: hypothetical protein QM809_10680 [Gordonia sp. (in: high G+C Gram-positive bacteria)]|uniref:hypothetical protein n=1 Tax=Gordonia sp. (in: high G+C Gram-positive bacteria) TaxID=84139 RepID=UPI0039E41CC9
MSVNLPRREDGAWSAGLSRLAALTSRKKATASSHEVVPLRSEAEEELASITRSLRILEESGGADAASLLEDLVAAVLKTPTSPPETLMSEAEESALREAGSFVERMPPLTERASTATVLRSRAIRESSLPTSDVARLLGVGESRVRQRAAARTLFALRSGRTLLFPRFQFDDAGHELPGWDRVAPVFPEDARPVAIEVFMTRPNVDLVVDGESVSPVDWLAEGHDPAALIELAAYAFHRHPR